jgi:hypothetical protein
MRLHGLRAAKKCFELAQHCNILDCHAHCPSADRMVCSYCRDIIVASVGLSDVISVDSNKRTATNWPHGLALCSKKWVQPPEGFVTSHCWSLCLAYVRFC